jgi:hypothetical protein
VITFVVVAPHYYTVTALHRGILAPLMPETRAITYDDLFARKKFSRGTYVFADMERLQPNELELAARYYRHLRDAEGIRVLNDPARVKTRFALLRALHQTGRNSFDVYWADSNPRPRRFPVFLRVAAEHDLPIGELIPNQEQLEANLRRLVDNGVPLAGILVIEFCGAPAPHGRYEKYAFFKVGETISLGGILLGRHWNVKHGESDLVTPEVLAGYLDVIGRNAYVDEMRPVFELAEIDYGRADVGYVNGRFEVYEINTNPNISATTQYVSELHRESRRIARERFGAMLHAIDLPATGRPVSLNLGPLDDNAKRRRRRARSFARSHAVRRRLDDAQDLLRSQLRRWFKRRRAEPRDDPNGRSSP